MAIIIIQLRGIFKNFMLRELQAGGIPWAGLPDGG